MINKTSLEKEIKNLIIYKKALYNADFINENELLEIIKPVLNSESYGNHMHYILLGNISILKMKNKNPKSF